MIVAADFFTIELWTTRALQRFVLLFFTDLLSRRVEIGGIAATANGLWMSQIARNLTDSSDGLLTGKRYLIHDRDPLFTDEFLHTLKDAGVEVFELLLLQVIDHVLIVARSALAHFLHSAVRIEQDDQ